MAHTPYARIQRPFRYVCGLTLSPLFGSLVTIVSSQEPHPETTRTGIWLRDSTAKMFNVARIPQMHCDTLSTSPPKPHSLSARSLLVMFHNFCYTIPVYSPTGQLSSPKDIYRRLCSVVRDVDARLQAEEEAFPIGVLSADDRDIWAKVRQARCFIFSE
jgi:carnitine O-acetyltransferase